MSKPNRATAPALITRRQLAAKAFVRSFVRCGYKAAPAWRALHPGAPVASSWAHGWEWLRRAEVQQELRRVMESDEL